MENHNTQHVKHEGKFTPSFTWEQDTLLRAALRDVMYFYKQEAKFYRSFGGENDAFAQHWEALIPKIDSLLTVVYNAPYDENALVPVPFLPDDDTEGYCVPDDPARYDDDFSTEGYCVDDDPFMEVAHEF